MGKIDWEWDSPCFVCWHIWMSLAQGRHSHRMLSCTVRYKWIKYNILTMTKVSNTCRATFKTAVSSNIPSSMQQLYTTTTLPSIVSNPATQALNPSICQSCIWTESENVDTDLDEFLRGHPLLGEMLELCAIFSWTQTTLSLLLTWWKDGSFTWTVNDCITSNHRNNVKNNKVYEPEFRFEPQQWQQW